jgi:glycerol-3-phosphate acyltransferase PlsY
MTAALPILLAYLIGSVSFAVVVSRAFALPDPHTYGSHNPGATNVLRTGNRAAAALTLLGDGLKGAVAVWLAGWLAAGSPGRDAIVAAAALAVFVGHLYPVFHRFAGGKGVATAAGAITALSWPVGLALAGVWLATALVVRVSSLSALVAAAAAPAIAWATLGNRPQTWVLLPIAALLVWRHRANIRKLLDGRESRIGR